MEFFFTPDYSEWSEMAGQKPQRSLISSWLIPKETRERFGVLASECFLLYGPSGCGKTHFGRAVGARLSKLGWKYAEIDASALLSGAETDIASQINEFYETLESVSQVVFLVTGVEQFKAGAASAWFGAALSRLTEPGTERIALLEVRDPDDLPPALSNLGRPVLFDYPDTEDRKAFLQRRLEESGFGLEVGVSLERVSEIAEGCSFRELEAVMTNAKSMLLHKACRAYASADQLDFAFANGGVQYTEAIFTDAVRITRPAGRKQGVAVSAPLTPEQMKQMTDALSSTNTIGLEKVPTRPKAVVDPSVSTVAGMQVEQRKDVSAAEIDLRSLFKK